MLIPVLAAWPFGAAAFDQRGGFLAGKALAGNKRENDMEQPAEIASPLAYNFTSV